MVAAAFSTINITQPILPHLQAEFGVSESRISLSVSVIILGIALANVPFGVLADRFSIRPIVLAGGSVVSACGVFCACTRNLSFLILARFVQGLFIPSLTTCLAVYLARNMPVDRLNKTMGSYVSATVAGGLGGRLLTGIVYPPEHWRFAFLTASILLFAASVVLVFRLPKVEYSSEAKESNVEFVRLHTNKDFIRVCLTLFATCFAFFSIFNYIPFYLSKPPFMASTQRITVLYFSYLIGIVLGPISGKLSNWIGNGTTIAIGSVLLAFSILMTLIPSYFTVVFALSAACAGFFTIHASGSGLLNRAVTSGRGLANSIYVLFYYTGGSLGIIAGGYAYKLQNWRGVVALSIVMLFIPFSIGMRMAQNKGKLEVMSLGE